MNSSNSPAIPRIKVKAMGIIRRTVGERVQVLGGMGYDKSKDQHFYSLIGGSVEFGETTEEALRREFREELDTDITIGTLLGWSENIFIYEGTPGHEVVAIYDVQLANAALYERDTLPILDTTDHAGWADVNAVKAGDVRLYPHGSERYI